MSKPLAYLGLDQSLRSTGICLCTSRNLFYGEFKTSRSLDMTCTLEEHNKLVKKITRKYSLQHVFIEDTYMGNSSKAGKSLFALKEWYKWKFRYEVQVNCWVLSPKCKGDYSWPAAVGVKGTKEPMARYVKRHTGILVPSHDVADAIGICLGGLKLIRKPKKLAEVHLKELTI